MGAAHHTTANLTDLINYPLIIAVIATIYLLWLLASLPSFFFDMRFHTLSLYLT
jgi:hypothetical protein